MLADSLIIRETQAADIKHICALCDEAFKSSYEGEISRELIADQNIPTISLVAVSKEDQIIGHVLLSKGEGPASIAMLGPLCVACSYRECGVGRKLVRSAINTAKDRGFEAIFVLGAKAYYGQFGFKSALADTFESPFQGQHFQALELVAGALGSKSGPVHYPAAFSKFEA